MRARCVLGLGVYVNYMMMEDEAASWTVLEETFVQGLALLFDELVVGGKIAVARDGEGVLLCDCC